MVDKLLRHPVPYLNESIGNYILRLCSENSCEVKQIADMIGLRQRGIENFYRKLKEENITRLSELTGIEIEVIEDMTVNNLSFYKDIDFGRRSEACVCPKCYSERPYERIHWKNKLIKVCLDHEIYLLEECPRCKKMITSNVLFNGKCDCGLFVKDFYYAKCVNEYILQNQNILYQIFNIKSIAPLREGDLLHNTLSDKYYCILLYHLQKLALLYDEDLSDLGIFFKNDEGFKSFVIASWIMFDWPVNLIALLDILNCLDIKYINRSSFEVDNNLFFENVYTERINDRFKRIINPLECLKLMEISYIVFRNKEIYQPIMNYYYENFNKENIKKKMGRYIYLNNYVDLDVAIKIFFDINNSDSEIREFVINYFHIYEYFNKEYLNLEEIFVFYDKIKKNSSVSFSDIEKITCDYFNFIILFQSFEINFRDIINVLISRNINNRIDPIRFDGIKSIHYNHKQTKKGLLLLLAERIDIPD